eukprot:Em0011g671a
MSEITSYMWSGEDASSLEVSALSWCLVFLSVPGGTSGNGKVIVEEGAGDGEEVKLIDDGGAGDGEDVKLIDDGGAGDGEDVKLIADGEGRTSGQHAVHVHVGRRPRADQHYAQTTRVALHKEGEINDDVISENIVRIEFQLLQLSNVAMQNEPVKCQGGNETMDRIHMKVLLVDTPPDRAVPSPNLKIYSVQEVNAAGLERQNDVQKRDDSVFCKGCSSHEGLHGTPAARIGRAPVIDQLHVLPAPSSTITFPLPDVPPGTLQGTKLYVIMYSVCFHRSDAAPSDIR